MKITPKTYYRIVIALSILAMTWAVYKVVSFQREKEDVLRNHSFTVGEIIDYDIVGDIGTHYLIYKYEIDSVEYIGKTVNPIKKYEKCAEYIGFCRAYRFWVMYSNSDRSISLIDVTHDISNDSMPIEPKDLSKFQ